MIGNVILRNSGILKLAETMQMIYRSGTAVDLGKPIEAALSPIRHT